MLGGTPCARALLRWFHPGERIAVWAHNLPEWVLLEYGAALARITLVTVNPSFQPAEVAYVLGQSRAAGLFLVPEVRGNPLAAHATAGLALMETGSGSEADLVDALDRLLPRDDRYRHRHGSKGHGADHLLPAIVGPSLTVPVQAGTLLLGTWQRIVLVDLNADNRRRQVRFSFVASR